MTNISDPTTEAAGQPSWTAGILWLAALAAAVWLRFAGLLDDTPSLDEWHPLLAVKREDWVRIASTFGLADRSIPVALYLESLSRTVGISELGLRLPFAFGGLLVCLGLPWLLRRRLGAFAAGLLALLLALSPLLVYYGRAIRPYGMTAGASVAAVLLYRRWRERARGRDLALFLALGAGVGWALPVHLPFCLGAPARDLAVALVGRAGGRRLDRRALAALAGALGLAALLLAPALVRDGGALAARVHAAVPGPAAGADALRALVGVQREWPAWIVAAAALAVGARRRRERWVADFGWASALLVAALALGSPLGIDTGIIAARYLLPVGIAGWIVLAAEAGRIRQETPTRRCALLAAAGLLGLALFAAGPLAGWLRPGADNFANTRLHERLAHPERAPAAALSAAYRRVAAGPRAGLVEVPFHLFVPRALPELQRRHGQEVFVGVTQEFCSRRHTFELPPAGVGGFRLRRFQALDDPAALAALGVRWVVFHRNDAVAIPDLPPRQVFYDFARCVEAFARRTGRTPFDDGEVALFDLAEPAAP